MNTVVIADDAMFMRTALRLMLERNGYKVVGEAGDGEKAVEKYMEFKPDVMTMDITMPGIDGIEAVKRIIQFDPNAKIIMVSSMAQKTFVKDAITAGAKGFIVKPFKEDVIIETLRKLSMS